MSDESEVQQKIQIEGVQYGTQLLRNNSGAFKDAHGRWIFFGLGNTSKKRGDTIKSSDLVGFTKVTITQEMVGSSLAVFTAVEVKKTGWKGLLNAREKAQEAFINWVRTNGGFAGFADSVESFKEIIGK